MKKKIFVVSDVHGHFTLMKNALDQAGYQADNESHILLCCGDYFDRGIENKEVLCFFERAKRAVLLRGNHEDMLLKLLQTGKILPHHYINGSLQTLQEFFGKYSIDPLDDTIDFSGKTRMVDRLCEFLEETKDYFETENYLFVHGWIPSADYREASGEQWVQAREKRWNREYDEKPPVEGKTLVCGHMPTFYANLIDRSRSAGCADIFYGNGMIAIDAGTYDSGQVNVLVLEEDF